MGGKIAEKYFGFIGMKIFWTATKSVISLSVYNSIKDHWKCATQSLLSSFESGENI